MKMKEDGAGGRVWELHRNDDGLWLSCRGVSIMLDGEDPAKLAVADEALEALESFVDGIGRLPCGEMDRFGLAEDWRAGGAIIAKAKVGS